jgi:Flp pilus assembly CpaF family ATPase
VIGSDELDLIVRRIRQEYADLFPLADRNETFDAQQLREERTRLVLERDIFPALAALRRSERAAPLDPDDEQAVIDRLLAEMFGVPNLLAPLRSSAVTDILVFGADPPMVSSLDGSITYERPIVRSDRELERVIYDIAVRRGRVFNHEHPWVDLELEPGVRFHGEGFDIAQRPFIAIRRAALFLSSLDDLYDRGAGDVAIVATLRAAVKAKLSVLFVGAMGSGKTTWLRAAAAEIDPSLVIATVESDFELNLLRAGRHRHVVAYQERIPTTVDSRGITPADLMRPAMRTRADWLIVGEVRGGEGAALVRAMQTGQGSMATVHGGSAQEGLEVLTDLVTAETGQRRHDVRLSVYRSTDLVVHLEGGNSTGRWVSEIVAPSIEDDGERFVLHSLFGFHPHAADERARPLSEPQTGMLRRLRRGTPSFDTSPWVHREDTYKPIGGYNA